MTGTEQMRGQFDCLPEQLRLRLLEAYPPITSGNRDVIENCVRTAADHPDRLELIAAMINLLAKVRGK